MPELPEVETVVRALRAAVVGARIDRIMFASRRVAAANRSGWKRLVAGRRIDSVDRRGKYIIVRLDDTSTLVLHLRLTGRLLLRAATRRRGTHDRLILSLSGGRLRGAQHLVLVDTRQFARADFCPSGAVAEHPGIARLGPEATSVTPNELLRTCAGSRRSIKALLLDQTRLAGLGNIYADESLFMARIHPCVPAHSLSRGRICRLCEAIRRVLHAAIRACGTTFDTFSDLSGRAGSFAAQLKVYRRDGEACRVCGATLRRLVVVGRGTHYCPRCQAR